MVALPAPPPTRPTHGPFSWTEFIALPDEDRRELIDGWLTEVEVPTFDHEAIVALLITLVGSWARTHGGRVLGSGYKVKVSSRRGVMPDLQYYRPGRRPPSDALTEGAPDLVVEVVSPSSGRYDRVTKLDYYRSIGVAEYWLVTPAEQSLHRFLLVDGHYRVDAFDGDQVVSPDTFPGLALQLGELWAAAAEAEPAPPEVAPTASDAPAEAEPGQ